METVFEPEIGNIIGPQKEGSWSGIFWQNPQDKELKEARGRLFLTLVISLPKGFSPPAPLAHALWVHLSNAFYGRKEGGVLLALEEAVSSSLAWLDQSVAPFKRELALQKINFGLVAGSLWGRILYLAQTGEASVKMVRSGQLKTILSSFEVSGSELFSQLRLSYASGFLQAGDFIIFATQGFQKTLTDSEILEQIEKSSSVGDVCETLSPKIHQSENAHLIAALILKINLSSARDEQEAIVFSQVDESKLQPIKQQSGKQLGFFWRKLLSKFKKTAGLNSVLFLIGKKTVEILNRIWPGKELYLKDGRLSQAGRRRLLTIILVFLIVVFFGSMFWGIRERGKTTQRERFDQIYQKASQEVEEAQTLLELNRIRSRELLDDAQNLLAEAAKLNVQKGKIRSLTEKIEKLKKEALKIVNATDSPLFFDLSLAKSQAKGAKIVLLAGSLAILDAENGAVYSLSRENKSTKVFAGDFAKGKYLASWEDKVFILKEDEGIYELNFANGQQKKVLDKDNNWGQLKDFASYNSNLYILDTQKNQIWKYLGSPSGFGAGIPFINKEIVIDLSKSVSFAINGAIWVLAEDGKLVKIFAGSVETMEIDGLDKPLSFPLAIETASEYKNIYILDKGNKRIVVVSKDGDYDSQYQADFLAGAQDFVVDESKGEIFVLSGSKIYLVNIQ